jgi:hypothetical protein
MLYEGFIRGTLRCRCHDSKKFVKKNEKKLFLLLCRIAPFPMTSLMIQIQVRRVSNNKKKTFGGCGRDIVNGRFVSSSL